MAGVGGSRVSATPHTAGPKVSCSENRRPTQTSCVVAGMVLAVWLGSENRRPTQTSCVVAGVVLAVWLGSENQRPDADELRGGGNGVGRLAG